MTVRPKPVARPLRTAADRYPIGVVHATSARVLVMWDVTPRLRFTADLGEADNAEQITDQVVKGVLLLASEAEKQGVPFAVNVSHPGVAAATAELLSGSENRWIEMVTADQQVMRMRAAFSDLKRARLIRRRMEADRRDLDGLAASVDPTYPGLLPAVVCGTDASRSVRPGGPVAYCYVTSEGRFAARHRDRGTVNAGELRGICLAVAHHTGRNMHILTDSQHAVAVLAGVRHPSNADELALRERVWQMTAKSGREITIQWVPGHHGVPLNEAANRIAFNEYRRVTLQVDEAVSQRTAEEIVAEFLPQFADPAPALSGPWWVQIREGSPISGLGEAAA